MHELIPHRYRQALLLSAVVALSTLAPWSALAQQSGSSAIAAAQIRFDQAIADMDRGDYASAAKKLEDVTQLVPEGVGAKETLAECYEKLGRLASAWSQYSVASALALKQGAERRAEENGKKASTLKPRLAMLKIDVSTSVQGTKGVQVTLNGSPVDAGLWGTPIPVDKGVQKVAVIAPGYRKIIKDAPIDKDGILMHLEFSSLEKESSTQIADLSAREEKPRSWVFPFGLTLAGVGLAGVGVGAAFGAVAIGRNNASNADGHCSPTTDECDSVGFATRREARSYGDASTAAFVAGGVVLAAGVTLALIAPRPPKTSGPRVSEYDQYHKERASLGLYFSGTNMGVRGSW